MSILAYTGLPGSGKSYTVTAHQIIPALKAGRRVVTNVPLHLDVIRAEFPTAELVELPLEQIAGSPEKIFEYVTPGSVLVLDEVWRLFPAGLKANQVPEPYRKLLAEHRHMVNAAGQSCQIVLVTQDLAQISAFARQLIEQTFRTVKLNSVGLRGGYRLDVFNGPVSGPNPPLGGRLREIYGRYESSVWRFYKSHTMSEATTEGADERAVDKRGNMLRSPVLLACAAVVVLGLVFVFPRAMGLLSKKGMTNLAGGESPIAAPGKELAAQAPRVGADGLADGLVSPSSQRVAPPAQVAAWSLAGYVRNLERPELSRVLFTDGTRTIVAALADYCHVDANGSLGCRYEGQAVLETLGRARSTFGR